MKITYRRIVSILLVFGLLTAGPVFAEQNRQNRDWHQGPPSPDQQLARMSEALGLNDHQSLDMLAVLQEAEEARRALHDQTMELMGPEICALRLKTEEEILAILDSEQEALFAQILEERESKAASRDRHRRGSTQLDCSS